MFSEPSTFRRNLLILASIAILARVAIGVVSWRTVSGLADASRQVARTQGVLGALESVRSGLQKAEVDQHTYLLTNQAADLESFKEDLRETRQGVDGVWNLTSDNPDQQARVVALIRLVERRFELAEATDKVRQTSGLEAARKLVLSGKGSDELSEVLAAIDDLRAEENRLLSTRARSERESLSRALSGIAAASFGSIFLIVAAAFWILRAFDARKIRS